MPTKGTGRSKKKEAEEPVAAGIPAAEPIQEPSSTSPAAVPAKKRTSTSKKPVKVIAVVTPDGIEGSFTPEPRRPLIAHLQIHSNDFNFGTKPEKGDSSASGENDGPRGYDPSEANPFISGHENLKDTSTNVISTSFFCSTSSESDVAAVQAPSPAKATDSVVAQKGVPCFSKFDLMVQFKESSQQKRLPDSTDVACFWCAHGFEGMPCIIPEREVNGVFTVYGNFCCPECAMSYLLNEGLDPHVRWERISLLHRVYHVGSANGRIFPAPCKESLKLFGGPMSIEEFRLTIRDKKVRVDMHMPPMVSILGSIDTKPIDFFDTTLKQSGPISAPTPAINRTIEEGLRLKRSKPLKDKESTLDTVMKIKIGGGVAVAANSIFGGRG